MYVIQGRCQELPLGGHKSKARSMGPRKAPVGPEEAPLRGN